MAQAPQKFDIRITLDGDELSVDMDGTVSQLPTVAELVTVLSTAFQQATSVTKLNATA